MKDILGKSRDIFPGWIKTYVIGTFVWQIYLWIHSTKLYHLIRMMLTDMKTIDYQINDQEVKLSIPNSTRLLDNNGTPTQFEPGMTNILDDLVQDDTIYYDVGAHFGYHVATVIALGVPEDQIHTFESSRFRQNILTKNFKNINANRCLVGDHKSGCTTIDSYCRNHTSPDIVKIDVEGQEISILTGMCEVLERHTPVLLIEVHPKYLSKYGGSEDELLNLISGHHYSVRCVNHRSSLNKTSGDDTYLLIGMPQ